MSVRAEQPTDFDAIRDVVAAAFSARAEADLVDAIRASEFYVPEWSLVAERHGEVVGHVMISYSAIHDDSGASRPIAQLSPLAVAPTHQGTGIGSSLVRAVTALADDAGEPAVVLEGNPAYYERFGFEPAAELGITLPLPSWAPPEAAQVKRLQAYDPRLRGTVVYPPAFHGVTDA